MQNSATNDQQARFFGCNCECKQANWRNTCWIKRRLSMSFVVFLLSSRSRRFERSKQKQSASVFRVSDPLEVHFQSRTDARFAKQPIVMGIARPFGNQIGKWTIGAINRLGVHQIIDFSIFKHLWVFTGRYNCNRVLSIKPITFEKLATS